MNLGFVKPAVIFRQVSKFPRIFCSNSEKTFKKLKKFYEKQFQQTYCLDIELHFSQPCEDLFAKVNKISFLEFGKSIKKKRLLRKLKQFFCKLSFVQVE